MRSDAAEPSGGQQQFLQDALIDSGELIDVSAGHFLVDLMNRRVDVPQLDNPGR